MEHWSLYRWSGALRRQENNVKAWEVGAIPKAEGTILQLVVRCTYIVGGGMWHEDSLMGAVSGAPLTVTTKTIYILIFKRLEF